MERTSEEATPIARLRKSKQKDKDKNSSSPTQLPLLSSKECMPDRRQEHQNTQIEGECIPKSQRRE